MEKNITLTIVGFLLAFISISTIVTLTILGIDIRDISEVIMTPLFIGGFIGCSMLLYGFITIGSTRNDKELHKKKHIPIHQRNVEA